MLRYIEMGFSESAATEAVERFGDNLHSGCHWLMTRETVVQIPKRLCRRSKISTETYYDSEVKFDGLSWKVDSFDKKHALVRVRSGELVRWEHISDARIEWVVVHHNQPRNTVPLANWRRKVGTITFPTFASRTKITVRNALSQLLLRGRPSRHDLISFKLWDAVRKLTTIYQHTPSRPKPRLVNSKGVHDFRLEWMTYFIALCDVYGIDEQMFTTTLYEQDVDLVLKLFPTDIHEELSQHLNNWAVPQTYLQQQQRSWDHDCLSLVDFKCLKIEEENIHLDVFFHDMTFVKLPDVDLSRLHAELQYLFSVLWSSSNILKKSLNLDHAQLHKTLKIAKKKHKRSLTPASTFVTELFPYQKQTLSWLTERESASQPTSVWGWERHQLADGFTFHTSVFGHLTYTLPCTTVRGGILAQDVGMGKTVEMLALIASAPVSGPTLVIMPATMLRVWMAEAQKHCPSLKTVKFHGARRSLGRIKHADIVCTTYRIVANESRNHVPTLGSIRWGRIVLDESHELKNINSATTKAVCNLHAPLKWCMSATPWPAQVNNVYAYMAFFNVFPFLQAIQLPSANYNSPVVLNTFTIHHICELISLMTWWQQKNHVKLNLPSVSYQYVECTLNQQVGYTHLVDAIRQRVLNLPSSAARRRAQLLYHNWLLQIATVDISLVPLSSFGNISTTSAHHSESKSIEAFVSSLGTSTYDSSVRTLVNSWSKGNVTCSICMDVVERPTLTPCNHMFCFECIQNCYQHDSEHKCPLCRSCAGTECLQELTLNTNEETVNDTWYAQDVGGQMVEMPMQTKKEILNDYLVTSSKIQKLLSMVQQNPKTVVFTQYHIAAAALCKELLKRNITFVTIQGKMSPKQRQTSIDSFQRDKSVKVFVMTLKTAGVGITLTAASSVIFLEPVKSPSLRKQAVGRVWRIGQTQPITVTTLVTQNTIDTLSRGELMEPRWS